MQLKSDIPDVTLLDELSPEPSINIPLANSFKTIVNPSSGNAASFKQQKSQQPIFQETLINKPSLLPINYSSNQSQQQQIQQTQQVPAEWLDILRRQNEEIKSLRSQLERLLNEQTKRENTRDASVQSSVESKKVETCSIGINTSIIEKSLNTPISNRFEETINSPFEVNKYNMTFGDIRIDNTSYETNKSERIIDMPEFNNLTSDK